jgi:plastocyanin
MANVPEFRGVGLGSTGADIVYAISAALAQAGFTTVSTTATADGVATAPDSWALTGPSGSAAVVVGAGDTVTFTPDRAGVYTISATTGTQVVTRRVEIGVQLEAGCWAEVAFDLDLPTIGATSPQDLSGGGAFTIGGVDVTSTVSGTLTTFAVNGNGVEVTDDTGSGNTQATLAISKSEISAAPGDIVTMIVEMGVQASGDDADRIVMRWTTVSSGQSGAQHNLWIDRNTSNDWQHGISQTTGVPNNGQIATAAPGTLRLVQSTDGARCDHWADNAGGTVTVPSDVTYLGSTASSPISGISLGARHDSWTTLDWWQIAPICQDSDASYYITRIACLVVRNTYGDV